MWKRILELHGRDARATSKRKSVANTHSGQLHVVCFDPGVSGVLVDAAAQVCGGEGGGEGGACASIGEAGYQQALWAGQGGVGGSVQRGDGSDSFAVQG